MGRKKKAADPRPLPVKSTVIRKMPSTIKASRPLEQADYEIFQQTMVARNRQKIDLGDEVAKRMAAVRESKKKIAELSQSIEKDFSIIEAGFIEEDRPCLKIFDYSAGVITFTDLESGAFYNSKEMNSCERQRLLNFNNPHNDCYACKYFACAENGDCQNFSDCVNCPSMLCGIERPCGLGKDSEDHHALYEPEEFHIKDDCYFCQNHDCDLSGENCRRSGDCLNCGHFRCNEGVDTEEDRPIMNPCPAGKHIPLVKPESGEEPEAA